MRLDRLVKCGLVIWGGLFAGRLSADVLEVGGSQYGEGSFQLEMLFQTSGTAVQYRLPTPTVATLSGRSNISYPFAWSIDVYDATFQPVAVWQPVLVNDGFTNSATFVQVQNPHPGQLFQFWIFYRMTGFGVVDAFGLSGDVNVFGYNTTFYTHPTGFIDTDAPAITSALNATLGDSRWQGNLFPGNRALVEKAALQVNDLLYLNSSINSSNTTASQVWLSRRGDCDDFVKLQCAILRRIGIPCRTLLVVSLGVPPDLIPNLPSQAPSLHAIGQYWNGDSWENFDSHFVENFSGADEMVLGMDQDFTFLYPAKVNPPQSDPFSLVGNQFDAVETHWQGGQGSFSNIQTRDTGPPTDIAAQTVSLVGGRIVGAPSDDLVTTGPALAAGGPRGGVRPRVSVVRNPAIDRIALAITGGDGDPIVYDVLDIQGRRVAGGEIAQGAREVAVDAARLNPGLYFVRVRGAYAHEELKVVLLDR